MPKPVSQLSWFDAQWPWERRCIDQAKELERSTACVMGFEWDRRNGFTKLRVMSQTNAEVNSSLKITCLRVTNGSRSENQLQSRGVDFWSANPESKMHWFLVKILGVGSVDELPFASKLSVGIPSPVRYRSIASALFACPHRDCVHARARERSQLQQQSHSVAESDGKFKQYATLKGYLIHYAAHHLNELHIQIRDMRIAYFKTLCELEKTAPGAGPKTELSKFAIRHGLSVLTMYSQTLDSLENDPPGERVFDEMDLEDLD
jgi:hypothetical protein